MVRSRSPFRGRRIAVREDGELGCRRTLFVEQPVINRLVAVLDGSFPRELFEYDFVEQPVINCLVAVLDASSDFGRNGIFFVE
jgi:hypothetical protein